MYSDVAILYGAVFHKCLSFSDFTDFPEKQIDLNLFCVVPLQPKVLGFLLQEGSVHQS